MIKKFVDKLFFTRVIKFSPMSRILSTSYKGGEAIFPSQATENKDIEYHKKWIIAALTAWNNNTSGWNINHYNQIDELREYGQGTQSNEPYKNEVAFTSVEQNVHTKAPEVTRIMWSNISWDVVTPLPAIRKQAINLLMKNKNQIRVNCNDEMAVQQKQLERWRLMSKRFMADLKQKAGIGEVEFIPMNNEQMAMYEAAGGLRISQEIAFEKLIHKSFEIGHYEEGLKRKVLGDLFDVGTAQVKNTMDPVSQKPIPKYCNIKYGLIPFSEDDSHNDDPYGGEIEMMTESEFREYALKHVPKEDKNAETEKMTPTDYRIKKIDATIAKFRKEYTDYNSERNSTGIHNNITENTKGVLIPVAKLEWKDVEKRQSKYRKTKDGGLHVERKKYNAKKEYKESEDVKYQPYDVPSVRYASMVLGEEWLIEWGQKEDVEFIGEVPKLSYHVIRVDERGIVSQVKSLVDDFCIAALRSRMALATAKPDGYLYDIAQMVAVSKTKAGYDPKKLMGMISRMGSGLFDSSANKNRFGQTSSSPVFPLPGGAGKYLEDQWAVMDRSFKAIEDISGINQFIGSRVADADTPVRNAEAYRAGASNILYSFVDGIQRLEKSLAENIGSKYQILINYNPMDVDISDIGAFTKNVIRVTKGFSFRELDYSVEALPTEEEKQHLIDTAAALFQKGSQPGAASGLTYLDYMRIVQGVKSGRNLKELELIMGYREQMFRQEHAQLMQMNQEKAVESGVKMKQLDAQIQAGKTNAEWQGKERIAAIQIAGKHKDTELKGDQDIRVVNREGVIDRGIEQMKLDAQKSAINDKE